MLIEDKLTKPTVIKVHCDTLVSGIAIMLSSTDNTPLFQAVFSDSRVPLVGGIRHELSLSLAENRRLSLDKKNNLHQELTFQRNWFLTGQNFGSSSTEDLTAGKRNSLWQSFVHGVLAGLSIKILGTAGISRIWRHIKSMLKLLRTGVWYIWHGSELYRWTRLLSSTLRANGFMFPQPKLTVQ